MTDIDALIAALRGRHVEELTSLGRDPDKYCSVLSSAADALTAERAKVAALEADVKFWQERHDDIQDRRKIDDAALQHLFCRAHVAAGHPPDDEDQSNDAHIGRLFIQHRYAFAKAVADQAEAARWREVARELGRVLADYVFKNDFSPQMARRISAALARYRQESGQ